MSLRELIYEAEKKNGEARGVFVPVWGVTVYFKPLTLDERAKIRKGAMTFDGVTGQNDLSPEQFDLITVLEKTLDEDGNKVFKLSDKEFLESSAQNEAIQYLSRIIHGGGKEVKDTAKNS